MTNLKFSFIFFDLYLLNLYDFNLKPWINSFKNNLFFVSVSLILFSKKVILNIKLDFKKL